jgi:hypothetical protein
MVTITKAARRDWAARVNRQAEQMMMIAAAANNDGMRAELLEYASRLEAHAEEIAAAA